MMQNLRKRQIVYSSVLFSFAWNLSLLIGVVLNANFVHTRAAGGQFTDFPASIRVIYFVLTVVVIYQVRVFQTIFQAKTPRIKWLPRFFFLVGIVATFLNALSRSPDERINTIPAAIITWAFWHYGVRKERFGS